MKVTPLNQHNTLFAVEDVYPQWMIDQCKQQDISSFSWEPLGDSVYTQAHTPRRMLICEESNIFSVLGKHVLGLIPQIKEITNKEIGSASTRVWADYPGYTINRHLDNDAVYITLQVYLSGGDESLGTRFACGKTSPYEHIIPYRPNTGYIMVNTDYNYHGMVGVVPENVIRLSSYTWFYN